MALSGSQITGIGVIGFPWRTYSGFTAKEEYLDSKSTFGVLSFMSQYGVSLESLISQYGTSAEATISQSIGVLSIISSTGESFEATISQTGKSVEDTI